MDHQEWWSAAEPADVWPVRQTAESWRQHEVAASVRAGDSLAITDVGRATAPAAAAQKPARVKTATARPCGAARQADRGIQR